MAGALQSIAQVSSSRPVAWWRPRPAIFACGVLLGAGLAAFNLLGRTTVDVDLTAQPLGRSNDLIATDTTIAGWPWPYLCLSGSRTWPLAHLDEAVRWISVAALLADVLAAALACGGAWLIGQRFISRRRWWQFGLFDIAGLTAIVSIVLAYVVVPRAACERDRAAMRYLSGGDLFDSVVEQAVWQPGPSAWLRSLIGEKWIPDTGQVIGLDAYGGNVREIVKLRGLRMLRVHGTITDRDLNQLARLPNLESLDVSEAMLRVDRGGWIDTPSVGNQFTLKLPKLKRLLAQNNVLQGSDLAELASLEELYLAGSVMDEESSRTIGSLGTLKILDLNGTALDDELLAQLAGLSRLELLDISGTAVTDGGLARFVRVRPDCTVRN